LQEKELKKRIVLMFELYQRQPSDELVLLYFEDLRGLSLEEFNRAFAQYRRDPRNRGMPSPAQLMVQIRPLPVSDKDQGQLLAAGLIEALARHGYTWAWQKNIPFIGGSFKSEFISELGPVAWEIVESFGGWQRFHDDFYASDVTTFRAQLRDLAAATVAAMKSGEYKKRLEIEGFDPKVLELLGEKLE
jgi:hypothetical protein